MHVPIQGICFLELAAPNISEGSAACVARGASKVAVVPILLLTAHHAKRDIPLEIEAGKIRYPHVVFTYGETFGVHTKIVDSLFDRLLRSEERRVGKECIYQWLRDQSKKKGRKKKNGHRKYR